MSNHYYKRSRLTPADLESIKKELYSEIDKYDITDPRSNRYIRIYSRPSINWFAGFTYALFITLSLVSIGIIVTKAKGALVAIISTITFLFITTLIFGKNIAIFCIKLYQRCAPESIRQRCVFEPSCSEYALQAFKKYGFVKGLSLTINRLKRCNPKGGGFDYLK